MGIQTVSQSLANEGISYGFKNKFINGDMRVNQRATNYTGISTNGQYMTDRWSIENGGLSSLTYTTSHSTDAPAGIAYSLSLTIAAASTNEGSTSYFDIRQGFEIQNLDDFGWGTSAAKPVTISFWVKNSTTVPFSAGVRCGVNGGTYCFFKTFTVNAINTWEKKTFTITAPTQFTSGFTNTARNDYALDFNVGLWTSVTGAFATDGQWSTGNLLGTANTNTFVRTVGANIKVTGFQMEVGSQATAFEYRSYGTELALCQRYYWRNSSQEQYNPYAGGYTYSSSSFTVFMPFPVPMRSRVTGIGVSASDAFLIQNTTNYTSSAVAFNRSSLNACSFSVTISGATAGQAGNLLDRVAGSWIEFTGAEI